MHRILVRLGTEGYSKRKKKLKNSFYLAADGNGECVDHHVPAPEELEAVVENGVDPAVGHENHGGDHQAKGLQEGGGKGRSYM